MRSFTLSTCEQAMIVIRKGLDLDAEQWTVWANDPDLDAVLAIWLLLNHRRIDEPDSTVRKKIMPIVRLQGVIDAHGFELKELTAFPDNLQDAALTVINGLRSEEVSLKKENLWGETDLLEFTAASLQRIDELVYTPHDFEEVMRSKSWPGKASSHRGLRLHAVRRPGFTRSKNSSATSMATASGW